jgi:hypothetical protein
LTFPTNFSRGRQPKKLAHRLIFTPFKNMFTDCNEVVLVYNKTLMDSNLKTILISLN